MDCPTGAQEEQSEAGEAEVTPRGELRTRGESKIQITTTTKSQTKHKQQNKQLNKTAAATTTKPLADSFLFLPWIFHGNEDVFPSGTAHLLAWTSEDKKTGNGLFM